MSSNRQRLKQLDQELASLPDECKAMSLSMLDGFIAGIAVCPEPIMPEEWLPFVWGGSLQDAAPSAEHADRLQRMIALVMEHNNATGLNLHLDQYEPVLDIDVANGEIVWQHWIAGFRKALQLRPGSWAVIGTKDEEARVAFAGLSTLADVSVGEYRMPKSEAAIVHRQAPKLIARWVSVLSAQLQG